MLGKKCSLAPLKEELRVQGVRLITILGVYFWWCLDYRIFLDI